MRLAVAAVACGLVSFLAGCGGGPEAPSAPAMNSSSAGPFAPVAEAGPFAPVAEQGPFAPVADPGPFAPVPEAGPFAPSTDPGPFGTPPPASGGGGTPAELCAQRCARAVALGCASNDCEAACLGELAQSPEACHALYAALLACELANARCNPNGELEAPGCPPLRAAFEACGRDINPVPGPVVPPVQQDGGYGGI